MSNFKDLYIWQESVNLAVEIYQLTSKSPFAQDFGLKDQCQRAAVSISSNIAEGEELDTNKQAIRHLYIAKGSCAELLTQLIIARRIHYISDETFACLDKKCTELSIKIKKFINSKSITT